MNLSISIRLATHQDNILLADLGRQTFEAAFGQDNTPEDMAAYLPTTFNPELQAAELADPQCLFWLIYVGEVVAGYIKFFTGAAPTCISSSNQIKIARLYFLPEWCGKGLGSEVLNRCIQYAKEKGHEVIWLTVWEHNKRALALYEKFGFKKVGNEDFVLGQDVQFDYIMEKTL